MAATGLAGIHFSIDLGAEADVGFDIQIRSLRDLGIMVIVQYYLTWNGPFVGDHLCSFVSL